MALNECVCVGACLRVCGCVREREQERHSNHTARQEGVCFQLFQRMRGDFVGLASTRGLNRWM